MTQPSLSENRNTKLGNRIFGWSIAPGAAHSCPGESNLCRTRCYAKRGFFAMPAVKQSHIRNYEFTKDQYFAEWLIAELRTRHVEVMRVHVSGDFYSPEYTADWVRIASAMPNTTFFAYTRSWRIDWMLHGLIQLGQLPNFQLWWSIDRETGPAPAIRGIRRAYMAINDADANAAPNDCDLVFRVATKTRMPKANGVTVCPVENGIQPKYPITCTKCGICWAMKRPRWESLFAQSQLTSTDNEIVYKPDTTLAVVNTKHEEGDIMLVLTRSVDDRTIGTCTAGDLRDMIQGLSDDEVVELFDITIVAIQGSAKGKGHGKGRARIGFTCDRRVTVCRSEIIGKVDDTLPST